ncbi:MAG: hypothetical protein AABY93_06805 [Bacteroidota bacterium]
MTDNPDIVSRKGGGIKEPSVKPKPEIGMEVLTSIQPHTLEDSHIYVHCYFDNIYKDMLIRIWETTFLIDKASGVRAGLLHAENISIAPQWTLIADGGTFHFLLVFSSLPKSCERFDFIEDITQPGGFFVQDILRNKEDVYHLTIA